MKHYPFIICIKCSVVMVSIYFDQVIIKCRCSSKQYFMKIKDYIHLLSLFDKEIKKHKISCDRVLSHNNNKAEAYCANCKEYLCSICIRNHKQYKFSNHYISLSKT